MQPACILFSDMVKLQLQSTSKTWPCSSALINIHATCLLYKFFLLFFFFTRYGKTAITEYKQNMAVLFSRLTEVLPPYCLMVWNTTLPISKNARGGFLVQEIEYKNYMLRMDVLEANYYARQVVVSHGFDVLDLHFWFRQRLDWRAQDGIHWWVLMVRIHWWVWMVLFFLFLFSLDGTFLLLQGSDFWSQTSFI